MDVTLFIVVIIISFIVVRIGAIAFQLTGLEWSLAKFQSLSCFTGTGFTTKEAELITGNKQRRKIATVLIILGHAGFVTMVATFASALNPGRMFGDKLSEPLLPFVTGTGVGRWINLALMIAVVYGVYKAATHPKLSHRLTSFLRRKIIRSQKFTRVSFEELLIATGGYGISRVNIRPDSPIVNKKLAQSGLRQKDVTVMAIIRGERTIANPSPNAELKQEDELICFGKLANIKDAVSSSAR